MTRPAATPRPGFTLVELLVSMAIIVTLAAIALIVVPDVLSQDRTTDGAATVRQHLTIAKSRAARDGAPRGVRFLVGADPNNVVKTNAGPTGQLWATELQYIERPPPLELNPNGVPDPRFPHVEVYCETVKTGPNAGSIDFPTYPQVFLVNPQATNLVQINDDIYNSYTPLLYLPVFQLTLDLRSTEADGRFTTAGPKYQLAVTDADQAKLMKALGGGLTKSEYAPQVVLRARPLLGEPTIQLPRNICVDLASSQPGPTVVKLGPPPVYRDYDILFKRNGQVDTAGGGSGQIFLWVRDYTKPGGDKSAPAYAATADFNQGGEQQVISLKTSSGSIGVFPIHQDVTNPFLFARQAAQ